METTEKNEFGTIHISDRAVAVLATKAVAAVSPQVSLHRRFAETAARKIGRLGDGYGVDVRLRDQEIELTVRIDVKYGMRVPDLAIQVQQAVKDTLEEMTGYTVTAVHVLVQSISFDGTGEGQDE